MSCVFCAILRGEEPASRVYEDDEVVAFMDIRPVRPGQLLVIPRTHVDHFQDLPDDLACRIVLLGQRIARVMRERFRPKRVGMIVHGFGVPHAHLIVLPLQHVWDITSAANAYLHEGEIRFRWEQVPQAGRNELDTIASDLALALQALPA